MKHESRKTLFVLLLYRESNRQQNYLLTNMKRSENLLFKFYIFFYGAARHMLVHSVTGFDVFCIDYCPEDNTFFPCF